MKLKTLYLAIILSILTCCGVSTPLKKEERPSNWANKIEISPLTNFYQVDENLYRSEQPNLIAMKNLEKYGIKSIVNVRNILNDKKEAEKTNLLLYKKSINTWTIKYSEVIDALKLILKAPKPTLIHCKHGSDRTGCIVAAYRIAINNWSKEDAIKEFELGGFGYHYKSFPNILKLLNKIDPRKLKKDLEII